MSYYNQIAGQRLSRIEALSDGVFAIAMTILVFDLKDPITNAIQSDKELLNGIYSMLPKFLSYFLSFMTLGIFWTGHSTQYQYITRYDRNLNWISIFFLMFASLLPFSTGLLSNHITSKVSIGLYWFNIFALGILIFIHWNYAYRKGFITHQPEEREIINKAVRNRVIISQSLYGFGALLCFISTYLSIAFIILVQLNYAFGIISGKNRH